MRTTWGGARLERGAEENSSAVLDMRNLKYVLDIQVEMSSQQLYIKFLRLGEKSRLEIYVFRCYQHIDSIWSLELDEDHLLTHNSFLRAKKPFQRSLKNLPTCLTCQNKVTWPCLSSLQRQWDHCNWIS